MLIFLLYGCLELWCNFRNTKSALIGRGTFLMHLASVFSPHAERKTGSHSPALNRLIWEIREPENRKENRTCNRACSTASCLWGCSALEADCGATTTAINTEEPASDSGLWHFPGIRVLRLCIFEYYPNNRWTFHFSTTFKLALSGENFQARHCSGLICNHQFR